MVFCITVMSRTGILVIGGERGIRTLDRVAPVPPFQGGDLNRSSISPIACAGSGL